ncbi:DUF4442 domain-containing protein [Aestuariibacter sp. AA17]|uniref:DUF4442 domain-containing protein n=1 Tax=Fluctibacter corallii TaxID=2984329 RepID=A0ABT3A6Y6_9ALTE|nr:DUF4442 domain-containing protein [Aestuariibacter sp. AA17]MCV2884423.1 DUF4442 domain-containing protein [Aestuariibacter sp. AA17]
MASPNPLRKFVDRVNHGPAWLSRRLITWAFRSKVKLAGTAKVDILETDGTSVTFRQPNYRKVQNHIGSVHAAGMALLAESATGFIVGLNLPGDKLPLLKNMNLNYVKRSTGELHVKAWLTPEQLQKLNTEEKGDISVAFELVDELGVVPMVGEMIWAWVPKKRG